MEQTNFPQNPPLPPSETMVVSSVPSTQAKGGTLKIILIVISILGLAGIVFGVSKYTGLFSKAAGGAGCELKGSPGTEILTANSVEIAFQTDEVCQTTIAYGTSAQPESLLLEMPEAMASASHRIKLSPLLPLTTYYYQIKVDDKLVGTIYNFLTMRAEGSVPVRRTETPTTAPAASKYTFEDFQPYFGTTRKDVDFKEELNFEKDSNPDKDVINFKDWDKYQTSKTR